MTEKFLHKSFCHIVMDEVYRKSVLHFRSIVNPYRTVIIEEDEEEESSDDDFVKED